MAREVVKKILDISVHQGLLTDEAVQKIKDANLGVILRIGYTGYESNKPAIDTCFVNNFNKLKAACVPVGAYYFTIAYTQAMADLEVEFILKQLSGRQWELPFYLDVEGQKNSAAWTGLSGEARATLSNYICSKVQAEGYYVGIYSSKHGFTSKWLDMSQLTHFDKWVAQYYVMCTYTGQYGMWQYSSKEPASKYGITKGQYVDINNAYYDFEKIIKSKGLNNFNKTKCVTCPHCGTVIEV